jgi:hypothetical protein
MPHLIKIICILISNLRTLVNRSGWHYQNYVCNGEKNIISSWGYNNNNNNNSKCSKPWHFTYTNCQHAIHLNYKHNYKISPEFAIVDLRCFFTFMWPWIVTNLFVIKPTRCTNFTNLFCHETLHVLESSSVHHQEFIHCKLSNGIDPTGL